MFIISLDTKKVVETIKIGSKAVDSHGMAFCEASSGTLYAINSNRVSATLDIISMSDYSFVLQDFDLTDAGRLGLQPDYVVYKEGKLYIAGRGPKPISAVAKENFNPNAVAGLYTVSIEDCTKASFKSDDVAIAAAPLTLMDSDFHGVNFVGDDVWGLDQQGTMLAQAKSGPAAAAGGGGGMGEKFQGVYSWKDSWKKTRNTLLHCATLSYWCAHWAKHYPRESEGA
jgi:hypothetical protein